MPVPTSFEPCWVQTPLLRVKTHAAPISMVSFGPPTIAVLPSADKLTELPWLAIPTARLKARRHRRRGWNSCARSRRIRRTIRRRQLGPPAGNPGGPFTPPSFQYQLSATSGTINYSISGYPNWLTPSSTSGTVSTTGTTVTFTVNATARNLSVGTYGPTTITFTNKDTGYGTQTRMATLTVYPPALQVTPLTNIVASGTHGGPFSPSSFRYSLSATFGSLNYSIVTPSWLTASPKSGTVTTASKTINFTINSNAPGLQPDTYVNSINFYNTTNNQGNTTRLATLTVNPKQHTVTVRAKCRRHGQRRWHICGRHFAYGDSNSQQQPHLRPLDRERARGQHLTELHVHAPKRQCHSHR
jgi:Viral BACON domain